MSRGTQDTTSYKNIVAYWAITIYGSLFQEDSANILKCMLWSYNPKIAETTLVWAVSISLATTLEITIVFFSSGYLDVSVHRVVVFALYLQYNRLPHSEIYE